MANLASKLNTDQSNLKKKIEGNPTLSTLQEIASALDVSVRDLLPNGEPSLREGVLRVGDRHFALVPVEMPEAPYIYNPTRFYSAVKEFVLDCLKRKDKTISFCGLYGGVCPFALVYEHESRRLLFSFCHTGERCNTWVYNPQEKTLMLANFTDELIADSIARSIINDIEESGYSDVIQLPNRLK